MIKNIINIDKEIQLIRQERDKHILMVENCTNCLVELQKLKEQNEVEPLKSI